MSNKSLFVQIPLCAVLLATLAPPLGAQTTVTIFFDGGEPGVPTTATDFSFMGSNWSGGFIATQGQPAFYASGTRAYHVDDGTAQVTFDEPIDSVNFFYVHGGTSPAGTATAFDSGGSALGSVDSNVGTFFGAAANFVTLDPTAPIARIEFTGGIIDNFSYTTQAAEPAPAGSLRFSQSDFVVGEGDGAVTISVQRNAGSEAAVSVDYATSDDSAAAGLDYTSTGGTLNWGDGDTASKSFQVPILDDAEVEGTETFNLALSNPTGGATLGNRKEATVMITDDDVDFGPCVEDATTLCLNTDRFRVTVEFQTQMADTGQGQAVELTDDSGFFTFFDPNNVEVVIKVLRACFPPFNSYWVFAAGLTNVEVTIHVVDTEGDELKTYVNPLNQPFEAIQDTKAFATCP